MTFSAKLARMVATATLACFLAAPPSIAAAQGPTTHFRGVKIDTNGLARNVGPAFAARIQRLMAPAAARAFADRITPGSGPLLVLQIDDLKLGPLTNGLDGGTDNVRGAALIVERDRVVAEYPLRAAHASDASVWHAPELAERIRLTEVCDFYAQWLRREMGL